MTHINIVIIASGLSDALAAVLDKVLSAVEGVVTDKGSGGVGDLLRNPLVPLDHRLDRQGSRQTRRSP